jgi:phospholipid N-methyltransferase
VLANTIGNVMKEVFFEATVDQVRPSYFNGYNPSAVGSIVPSSSQ